MSRSMISPDYHINTVINELIWANRIILSQNYLLS